MTFLEICQSTRQECGISGTGPVSVVNQSGEMKRIVDWVKSAWRDVQMRMPDWQWMRAGFTFNCTIGAMSYTPVAAGITDFAEWNLEHVRVYDGSTANEFTLTYVPYDQFRHVYMRGILASGKPSFYTVTPDKSLRFYPTPNAAYTIYGDYIKTPTELALDADTPGMPARFHPMLVYRAMMKYGAFEAAPDVYQLAYSEYNRMLRQLEHAQLPDMQGAEPLV